MSDIMDRVAAEHGIRFSDALVVEHRYSPVGTQRTGETQVFAKFVRVMSIDLLHADGTKQSQGAKRHEMLRLWSAGDDRHAGLHVG